MVSRYSLDPATGVFRPHDSKTFAYSEPDEVEEKLLRTIRGVKDRSSFSPELCALMTDWSTFYHFTPKRANLLRPLRSLLAGDVLEVGAGCGAVTRYLGEVSNSVTAVEGSLRRASIARERSKDLANVSVYCDNIQDFESDRKFDIVTCIGVLEYGNIFLEDVDGVSQMLNIMRGFLAEGGLLLIAIENRLGLKYFAGDPEDHLGVPYFGVQNLYTPDTAVTFGKGEMEQLLDRNELAISAFLYPFPDYKQPDTIFTDEAFELSAFPFSSVLTSFEPAVQNSGMPKAFSETLAWPTVAANGLGGALANSFLVVAQRQGDTPRAWEPEALVYKYATLRLKQHTKEMQIVRNGEGFTVRRRPLFDGAGNPFPGETGWVDEDFIQGEVLMDALPRVLARPQWTLAQLAGWAKPWLEFLRSRCAPDATLPPNYIDCAPFNIIRQPNGNLHPFDLEWSSDGRASLDWVAFRGLFHSLDRQTGCAPAANLPTTEIATIVFTVLDQLGLPVADPRREEILRMEGALMHAITGANAAGSALFLGAARMRFKQTPKSAADSPFLCRLCWTTTAGRLDTGKPQTLIVTPDTEPQSLLIPFPEMPPGDFEFFLMPADRKGVVRIWGMSLIDEQSQQIWNWNPARQPELPRSMTNSRLLASMDDEPGRVLHLYSDASCLLLPIPAGLLRRGGEKRLEVLLSWVDPLQHLEQIFDLMPSSK